MSSAPTHARGRSGNADEYRQVFITRVHQLIKMGYDRMVDRPAYRAEEEPAITGDLVDAIDRVLDDPDSGEWMAFYWVCDDPPINEPRHRGKRTDSRRKGKRRRRVDIRIDSSDLRPRTRFAFEAKRLGDGHPVDDYLGHEGLGRFLRGEYAPNDNEAGMLGYVQSGDPRDWADRIGTALTQSANSYGVLPESPWRHQAIIAGLQHTYRSGHRRVPPARAIELYHTLLAFF